MSERQRGNIAENLHNTGNVHNRVYSEGFSINFVFFVKYLVIYSGQLLTHRLVGILLLLRENANILKKIGHSLLMPV